MPKPIDGVPSDIIAARDAAECLFDEAAVERAVDRLAVRLTLRLHDAHPIVMCVMNGGMILTAELLLRLQFPLEVSYVTRPVIAMRPRAPCSSGAPRRPRM
jgi:hypoxanthine phosphoribosyltransferase